MIAPLNITATLMPNHPYRTSLISILSESSFKGTVQRILRGVETGLIWSMLVNWRPAYFSFWILKRHYHKRSIKPFSGLKINEMALSDQSDFPAFSCLRSLTEFHKFMNMTIRCRPCSIRWLYGAKFEKIDFRKWQTAKSQCVTESLADCWKECRSVSITLTKQSHLINL